MQHISPSQVLTWAQQGDTAPDAPLPVVLDVREPWEVQTAAVQDAQANGFELIHMPMRSVPARYMEMDRHRPIACLCHHGARSAQVAYFLMNQGYTQVVNIQGGIHAWALEHDPRVPLY
jgi:rhodanese-related sulfurtransferase